MKTDQRYVLGVDIGGTHISSALVDMNTNCILEETYASNLVANMEPQETILQSWGDTLNKSIKAADRKSIRGVAFAMPGPFNYKKGIALYPEGFKYGELHGIHIESALQSILEEKLPMRFLNDATSFAVGEAWLSHNGMKEKQLCITLGTGLGAGFTRKGIPVVHDASVPPEGSLWNLPYREGIADDYFSTRGFITAYQNLTGIEVNGVRELANHYETDSHAKQVFDAFGENLGNFLSPWLKRFDADTLIIGGNIAKAYAHFENTLENTMKAHGLKLSVRIAKHSEKGAIIGSTLLFNEVFWNKVKKALPKY
ncbi:MAG: ROK family protein [Bacteroidota bacterium]